MDISEGELRDMVRAAIARQGAGDRVEHGSAPLHVVHASHTRFELSRGADADGQCVIEPSVRCNNCGYCLSYGH